MSLPDEGIVVVHASQLDARVVTLECEHPAADPTCVRVTYHPRQWGWADALAAGWRARPWAVGGDGLVVVHPAPSLPTGAQQFPPHDWRRCCPRHASDATEDQARS